MLLLPDAKTKQCYDRAARARQVALECSDPFDRAIFLESERRWLGLAEKYQFAARLDGFNDISIDFPHPRCTTCAVPMWFVNVEHRLADSPLDCSHYECKVCEAKLVVPELPEMTAERAANPRRSNGGGLEQPGETPALAPAWRHEHRHEG